MDDLADLNAALRAQLKTMAGELGRAHARCDFLQVEVERLAEQIREHESTTRRRLEGRGFITSIWRWLGARNDNADA